VAPVVKATYILEEENAIKEVDVRPVPANRLGRKATSIVSK